MIHTLPELFSFSGERVCTACLRPGPVAGGCAMLHSPPLSPSASCPPPLPLPPSAAFPIIASSSSIEAWCNTVKAQIVVAADTVTILTGAKTEQQCAAERMRGDDELIDALTQMTNWRRDGDVLTLRGTKTLRFRPLTN